MRYSLRPIRTLPQRAWLYWWQRFHEVKNKLIDHFFFRRKVLTRINHRVPFEVQKQSNQIVFVSDKPRSREAKLVFALTQSGWDVVLLYQVKPNFVLNEYFTRSVQYKYSWQALYLALEYNPQAFHVFALWDCTTAYIFCKYMPGKIVIDINDTIKGTATDKYIAASPWIQQFIPMEKYLIENADGLCCRDFQVPNAARQGGYQRVKNTVFFPEYCWSQQVIDTPKLSAETGELHVVLIGHFGLKTMGDEKEAGYWDMIQAFTAQGIHFHIYPHWFYKKVYFRSIYDTVFGDYYRLADENPFFHIHESVPMTEVVQEISQYDFGIHVMRAVLFELEYERYTPEAMKICTSARISDYIEAGLLIIATSGTYMYQYLSRFGIMVNLTKENMMDLKEVLIPKMTLDVRSKILMAQEELTLSKHRERLIDFYKRL